MIKFIRPISRMPSTLLHASRSNRRAFALCLVAMSVMAMLTLESAANHAAARSGDDSPSVSVEASQMPDADGISFDASSRQPVLSSLDELKDEAIGLDMDFSLDFLTAELPVAHTADLDFRHVFSHGMTDECVFAIALPRSVPTAIP